MSLQTKLFYCYGMSKVTDSVNQGTELRLVDDSFRYIKGYIQQELDPAYTYGKVLEVRYSQNGAAEYDIFMQAAVLSDKPMLPKEPVRVAYDEIGIIERFMECEILRELIGIGIITTTKASAF